MKRYIFALGTAVILLTGCTSPTQPTAPPDTTLFLTETPLSTTPTLPWIPDEDTTMRREEYFAEVHPYDINNGSLYFGRSWGDYSITYGEGELLVTDILGNILHNVPNVDTNINWVACDDSWIYGIRNGRELLRIAYLAKPIH